MFYSNKSAKSTKYLSKVSQKYNALNVKELLQSTGFCLIWKSFSKTNHNEKCRSSVGKNRKQTS